MKLLDFFIDVSIRAGNAIGELDRIDRTGARAERRFLGLSGGAAKLAASLLGTVSAVVIIRRAWTGFINSMQDYENGMVGVAKTTDLAGQELAEFKQGIKKLARNPEVGATASQLMELAETAGTLGVRGKDNLLLFSETMAKLGTASGGKLVGEEAAQAIVNIINASGEDASNVDNLASSIADLGNSAAANEAQIVSASTNVAKSLRRFRPASHQVIALGTAFAEMKISPELAGTAVSKTLNQIEKALASGGKEMAEFKKVTGLTEAEIRKMLKDDAAGLFARFAEGLNKAQASGRSLTTVLDTLGLDDIRTGDTLKSIATEADRMNAVLEQSKAAFEENTALDKEAAKAGDTYAKKKQAMMESIKGLADTIANTGILELFKTMFDGINNVVAAIDGFLNSGHPLAELFDPLAMGLTAIIVLLPTLATILLTTVIPAIWAFTTALLANPFTWVVIGIFLLVKALMWLWKNWGDIGNKIIKMTEKLFGPAAAQFVARYINAVKTIWYSMVRTFRNVIRLIKALFTGDFKGAWQAIKDIVFDTVHSIISAFSTLFPNAAQAFKDVYNAAKEWIYDKLGAVLNWAKNKLSAVGNWFKGLFRKTDKEIEIAQSQAAQEALTFNGGTLPPPPGGGGPVVGVTPSRSNSTTTIDARQENKIIIQDSKDPRATGRAVRREIERMERGAQLDATS